jgi:hypothetical protein
MFLQINDEFLYVYRFLGVLWVDQSHLILLAEGRATAAAPFERPWGRVASQSFNKAKNRANLTLTYDVIFHFTALVTWLPLYRCCDCD